MQQSGNGVNLELQENIPVGCFRLAADHEQEQLLEHCLRQPRLRLPTIHLRLQLPAHPRNRGRFGQTDRVGFRDQRAGKNCDNGLASLA